MARRASVYEGLQIGAETTPGTEVAAAKRLGLLMGRPRPRPQVQQFLGAGSKFPLATVTGKEFSELPFTGPLSFSDIVYILAMHLKAPAISGGTFTYVPATFGPDTVKTMSMQAGSSVRAEKLAYCFCPEVRAAFNLRGVTLSGTLNGRSVTEGATLTATPTLLKPVPVGPASWVVQVGTAMDASDLATLGAADGVLSAEWNSRGKWAPGMFADGTTTFADPVERAPDMTAQVVMEHGSTAAGYLADLRASTKRLMRILATGPVIGAGPGTYLAQWTFPFEFQTPDSGDSDDLAVRTYTVRPVFDSAYLATGGTLEVVITNELSAL